MTSSRRQLQLYFFGMVLFLLGLLVGLVNPAFKNPRLGLSAHLEGVMNGMFLILVGIIWPRIQLSAQKLNVAFWCVLWGGFANWAACVLGAMTGASRMTPIAGMGMNANPMIEGIVASLFISVGLTMIVGVSLMVWGLRLNVGSSTEN